MYPKKLYLLEVAGWVYSDGNKMPKKSSINLDRIKSLSNIVQDNSENIEKEKVRFFASFDLVNSTIYKSKHPNDWILLFNKFYELTNKELSKIEKNTNLWKCIGDEVLFYFTISDIVQIYNLLTKSYDLISNISNGLINTFGLSKDEISIKCTFWCGITKYIPPQELKNAIKKLDELNKYLNIETRVPGQYETTQIDFLGSDIDLGFRISKYAYKQKVLVSAELVRLIEQSAEPNNNQRTNLTSNMKIVSFEDLKGIWNDRLYPIIWYYPKWIEINQTFSYDEHHKSEIIKNIKNNQLDDIDKLPIVLSDNNVSEKIDMMFEIINKTELSDEEIITIPYERSSEVHCVAIIINKNNEVFVAKRPDTKKRLPGKWEFGCGQLQANEDFIDCLKKSYKLDFGIGLEISTPLKPVNIYVINDSNKYRKIPGIIFAVKIDEILDIEEKYDKEKHSAIKWIKEDELSSINQDDYVEDAIPNIKLALSHFKNK